MKARELASIALKILGVYWFVHAFLYLVRGALMPFMGLEKISGFNWKMEIVSLLLFFALYMIVSYFLVFRTSYLLRVIRLDEQTSENDSPADSVTEYKPLAFSLLGVYFAVPAFGKITANLIKLWQLRQSDSPAYGLFERSNIGPNLAENVVELLVGVALIAGRERLAQLWKCLRPLAATKKTMGRNRLN